jgi:hypothetical protein
MLFLYFRDGPARFNVAESNPGEGKPNLLENPAAFVLSLAKVLDVLAPKRFFGPKLIVSATANANVIGVVGAAERPRIRMIELEKGARFATTAVRGNIRAPKAVSLEDFSASRIRNAP